MAKEIEGLRYTVPWLNILVVALIAFGASMLTTFLSARQAARVYPAKALRYEKGQSKGESYRVVG